MNAVTDFFFLFINVTMALLSIHICATVFFFCSWMPKQKFFDSDLPCQISFYTENVQAALCTFYFLLIWFDPNEILSRKNLTQHSLSAKIFLWQYLGWKIWRSWKSYSGSQCCKWQSRKLFLYYYKTPDSQNVFPCPFCLKRPKIK
jgi:hypothetical protein